MHCDQATYRELYQGLMSYDGSAAFDDLVRPWIHRNGQERRWLAELASRPGSPIPPASVEDRWRLYALSRILDLLQLSFAPQVPGFPKRWGAVRVDMSEYLELGASFGFTQVQRGGFLPFFHEVVQVEQSADRTHPPAVLQEYWPGFMLGSLMIARAGCKVVAGAEHIHKDVAERSTMYWAFARDTRPTQDLSVGWGSNSQWRTAFRRDYCVEGALHYNVDGTPAGDMADDDLTADERLELLRHRCFVRCTSAHDDRWPYDLRHVEPDAG